MVTLSLNILLHLVRGPSHSKNAVNGGGPRVDGLSTPHPEARGDPHRQDHEVLQHEHREVGGGLAGGTVRAEKGPLPPEKHSKLKRE